MQSRHQEQRMALLRQLCAEKGLAFTHQRMILLEALAEMHDHPSPEAIYERVRQEIPSISLGTVYKNIKAFVDAGLLKEVSLHHGTQRLETNLHPHHHLICTECRAILDLDDEDLEPVTMKRRPPKGFKVERISVEVHGLCENCNRRR